MVARPNAAAWCVQQHKAARRRKVEFPMRLEWRELLSANKEQDDFNKKKMIRRATTNKRRANT